MYRCYTEKLYNHSLGLKNKMYKSIIRIKRGLVAFFDILGYQRLVERNPIQRVAQLLIEQVTKLPSLTKKDMDPWFELYQTGRTLYAKKFSTILISDSIILTCDYGGRLSYDAQAMAWEFFYLHAGILCDAPLLLVSH
jgi:hypothetical protein